MTGIPRGAVACLSTVVLSALLATACSAAQPAPAPPGDAPAPKPKVDRLVMAALPPGNEGSDSTVLALSDNWQLRPMYEYLVGMDGTTGKLIPELSTQWQLEPDGLSFRFVLRRGVQFQKGYGEFTANDIPPIARQVTREDSTSGRAPFWRAVLADVQVVNDYEAIFRLKRADGYFLSSLSAQGSHFEMRSNKHFQAAGTPTLTTAPIAGTGPYQFKERTQGSFVRFERTPSPHWRTTPDFPEFEFRWAKEASVRLAALLTGEVQLAELPSDLLAQAEKQGYQPISAKSPALRTFITFMCCFLKDQNDPSKGYMYPDAPLMDVRVRKALSKAINRDDLNRAFFGGKGLPMQQGHLNPTRPGWDPTWETRFPAEYGFDLNAAKALLAQAGYDGGKRLSFDMLVTPAAGYSGAEDVAEAVAAQWKTAGVDVKLAPMEFATILQTQRAYKFANNVLIRGTASDATTGINIYGASSSRQGGGVEIPAVDDLFVQVGGTLDEKKQDELWRRMGEVVYTEHREIPLFWLPIQVAANRQIVADWVFPGSISGNWSHVENIKAAK